MDDASKSLPETILQLQAFLDKLQVSVIFPSFCLSASEILVSKRKKRCCVQENQTMVISSLEQVGERLDTLEKGVSKGGTLPQGDLQVIRMWYYRVATKWVSGYFAKYEIGRNKTFFSRNFGGIPRNSAKFRGRILPKFRMFSRNTFVNFAEFRGIIYNFAILVNNF